MSEARYITLETYRKSGKPVQTTVWVVGDGGELFVRTGARSGKVKRVRGNPHVRIAPTTLRGKVIGDWEEGVAHFVEGEQSGRIIELFKRKYGLQIKLLGLLAKVTRSPQLNPVFIGIELAAG